MGRWIESNIGLHFSVQGGYAFKSEDYTDDGAMLFRISNAGKGYFDFKDLVYLPTSFYESLNNFSLNEGDIVMGMTGDLGKICKIPKLSKKILLNQRVGRFVEKGQFDKRLLYYYLTSDWVQNSLSLYFAGGAQANISPKQIESIIINHPESLDEQRKIAQILSKVDEAIDSTQALIDKHELIKEGMMHDLFTRGIDPATGSLRPHPSDAPELYQDSELGLIPKEWEVKRLGDVCTLTSSKRIYSSDYQETGIPFWRSKEVIELSKGKRITSEYFITEKKYNSLKTQFGVPSVGDILISAVGTLGVVYRINKKERFYFKDGNLIWLKNRKNVGESEFLELFLNTYIDMQFDKVTIGTSQKAFTIKSLNLLNILYVGEESKMIKEKINKIKLYIQNLNQQKQKLLLQKQGLMHDLLSGKVRVM